MKNSKQTVLGIYATAAKPELRGFVMLGMIIAAPVGAVLFGVEAVMGWAFQMME